MTPFSQRDLRWFWKKLGTSRVTIGGYGCAITTLSMLSGRRPDEVNDILTRNGGYASQNLVIWAKACEMLGLEWAGLTAPKKLPAIAQVRGGGFPMHFVVWLGNNQIIDPWDGRQKANPYQFVGWRSIHTKESSKAPAQAPQRFYTVKRGDTLSKISLSFYGTSNRVKDIAQANNIKNPNIISIGKRLLIP